MNCEACSYCRYPRSENDNNGLCKCKIMKNKTIDVYVGGGETPSWCPLDKQSSEVSKAVVAKTQKTNGDKMERLTEWYDGRPY